MSQSDIGKMHLSDSIKGERREFLNSEVCQHTNTKPIPALQHEYGHTHQCFDCDMIFNALEFEAIRQSHFASFNVR